MLSVIMLSNNMPSIVIVIKSNIIMLYANMLSVIILSAIMLSVILLSVIMLIVSM